MIDKKISVSEQVANLSIEAQLLFTWMIPHADDAGILPHSPKTIKALVVPMWDVTSETVRNLLDSIEEQGLIQTFTYHEKQFYKVNGFLENQTLKKDRQPNTIIKIKLEEDFKKNWQTLEEIVANIPSGFQMVPHGNQMEPEGKLREVKGREYNIGDSRPEKNTNGEKKKGPRSLAEILAAKNPSEQPKPQSPGITKEWQEKAFREMEYIGVKLKEEDVSRVMKVYKDEFEGWKYKAPTNKVIAYLKDYPTLLDYEGKLNMFFKLVTNGFTSFEERG